MGILDAGFDPRTQGLLAAAFQGLQASGPSRMPMSLGQIIGQAGSAGINEYRQATMLEQKRKRAEALMALEQQKAEAERLKMAQDLEERKVWSNALGGGQSTGLLGTPNETPAAPNAAPSLIPSQSGSLIPPEQTNPNQGLARKLRAQVSQYADIFTKNPSLATTKQGQVLYGEMAKLTEAANKLDPTETFHAPTAGTVGGKPGFGLLGNRGSFKPVTDITPPVDYNKAFLPDGKPNAAYQKYDLNKAAQGATRVSVDNRALGKYADTVGGKSGEDDIAQFSVAQAASENAKKLDETLSILKNSNAITGMGADVLKNVERAKVLFANDIKAGKKVSDTEYLNALLGSDVFPMIKELGIGARGLDTPAEREFLREVMSGTINMNKDTLIRMTQIRRDIAQRSMDKWNARVKSGELDDFFKYANRPKTTIDYQPSTDTWTAEKEARYQELLRKQNGAK